MIIKPHFFSQTIGTDMSLKSAKGTASSKLATKRWEALFIGAECSGKSLFVKGLKNHYMKNRPQPSALTPNDAANNSFSFSVYAASSLANKVNNDASSDEVIPIGTFLSPTVGVDIVDVTMEVTDNSTSTIQSPVAASPSSPGFAGILSTISSSTKPFSSSKSPKNNPSSSKIPYMASNSPTPQPAILKIDVQLRELGSAISSRWVSYFNSCNCLVFLIDISDVSQWAVNAMYLAELQAYRNTLLKGKPILLVMNRMEECDLFTQQAAFQMLAISDWLSPKPTSLPAQESQHSASNPSQRMSNSYLPSVAATVSNINDTVKVIYASAGDKNGIKCLAQHLEEIASLHHQNQRTTSSTPLDVTPK